MRRRCWCWRVSDGGTAMSPSSNLPGQSVVPPEDCHHFRRVTFRRVRGGSPRLSVEQCKDCRKILYTFIEEATAAEGQR